MIYNDSKLKDLLPLRQGMLLDTKTTLRWPNEARERANEQEHCMVFTHFLDSDQGKSRCLVMTCANSKIAAELVALLNGGQQ